MTCREFIRFLMDYLEGQLDPGEHHRFEGHLEICPECESYLDSYRATVALGREVCRDHEDGVPAEVPEELVEAILDARRAGG